MKLIFQNDRIYGSITCGNWFLLSIRQQMMYQILMQKAQNASALSIGGLYPLNMVSCASVN